MVNRLIAGNCRKTTKKPVLDTLVGCRDKKGSSSCKVSRLLDPDFRAPYVCLGVAYLSPGCRVRQQPSQFMGRKASCVRDPGREGDWRGIDCGSELCMSSVTCKEVVKVLACLLAGSLNIHSALLLLVICLRNWNLICVWCFRLRYICHSTPFVRVSPIPNWIPLPLSLGGSSTSKRRSLSQRPGAPLKD